jgi:hypothetical protein
MAKVELAFETSLELEQDEVIIYADVPNVRTLIPSGFLSKNYLTNIAVTNKRVVSIPHPNKKDYAVQSWYYNKDITGAKTGEVDPNGTYAQFHLTTKPATDQYFMMTASTGKQLARVLGAFAKDLGAGMMQQLNQQQASQARSNAENAGSWKSRAAWSNSAANSEAWAKMWENAQGEGSNFSGEQFVQQRDYLVDLINQCIAEAAKG